MSPVRLSRLESSTHIVLDFVDAFNRHDADGMAQLMSDDCLFENSGPAPDGRRIEGQAAFRRYWQQFFAESPHARLEIEEIFGLGHNCVVRWKYHWDYGDSERLHVRGVDIYQIAGGKIREKLTYVKG